MTTPHKQTITVIGAGYVGLTTAVLLAESGYRVYILENNNSRLDKIKQGKSFFYEKGIEVLISHSLKSKKLIPTDMYSEAIPKSDVVFSCVGTPDNPDGSTNLSYVFSAAEKAIKYIQKDSIFVQKSTVPVGTGEKIEKMFAKSNKNIAYVSNPEFLREGTAIIDSLWFDRIVVGSINKDAANNVLDIYKNIENQRTKISQLANLKLVPSHQGQYFTTNRNSAELIKVTANAFLALKISFANSIAKLADQNGADINDVMDVVGADHRIGRDFLNAGRGYGGGCFPKDVTGLISSASKHGVELQIMTAASDLNNSMPGYIVSKAQQKLKSLKDKQIAVLGLAFKVDTSDARRSPGVSIANIASHDGASVNVYDPKANEEARDELRRGIEICNNIEDTVMNADAVFVSTEWPEFTKYKLPQLAKSMKGTVFVDCMNVFDIGEVESAGLQYIGVGRNGNINK